MPQTAYPPGLDSFTWIFEDNLDDVFQSTLPSPWHDLLATDFDFSTGKDEAQPPETLEQEDWEIDESNEEIDELPQPTPQDRCNPDDVWPMEWHAASAQCLTLPNLEPLNQDLNMKTGSFYPIQSVTESMRARLLNSVRLPLERVPWQTTSLANFPSKDKLDHCIDLFFRHFDRVCLAAITELLLKVLTWLSQTFTVIHRPTFDPSKFPVLTLAMASVGACYSNFGEAHRFSNSLSELVRRLLTYMVSV